ncbi:putative lipoprotein [Clostridioides difficile CD160]|nr:putative lipoprotein [Clostridioides difficile CD160]
MRYKIIVFISVALCIIGCSFYVNADVIGDLNGIGENNNAEIKNNEVIENNNGSDLDNNSINPNENNSMESPQPGLSNNLPDYSSKQDKDSIRAAENILSNMRISSEETAFASFMLSPIMNLIRKAVSIFAVLIMVLYLPITASDLIYITFPPIRNFLYKKGNSSFGNQSEMYGMGSQNTNSSMRWVSDELVSCVSDFDRSQQQNQGFDGMQMPKRKILLISYLKRRSVSIVLLIVSVVLLLMTTVFSDLGIKLAILSHKLILILIHSISG